MGRHGDGQIEGDNDCSFLQYLILHFLHFGTRKTIERKRNNGALE